MKLIFTNSIFQFRYIRVFYIMPFNCCWPASHCCLSNVSSCQALPMSHPTLIWHQTGYRIYSYASCIQARYIIHKSSISQRMSSDRVACSEIWRFLPGLNETEIIHEHPIFERHGPRHQNTIQNRHYSINHFIWIHIRKPRYLKLLCT